MKKNIIITLLAAATLTSCGEYNKLLKSKEYIASENPLEEATTYHIDGRSFVVKPVFKDDSTNTFGTILLRLMQADCERKM